ncbi:glypican-like protein [Sarcoptes scabiei]|uniref:Glypican-like protein n=1 Tax=Sarcoptes scabiei TaxID=52283 RepID=A0A132AIL4_SARSC|nr:glypican-like protein [Sarcoptes scabiei]
MSHADFHRMFSDTYGILYDRHSFIFNDMFHNLEKYYNDGSIDLDQSMREFFSILYKKMFEELNAQYAFDAVYLNCTVAHMEEMMPFGELPQKLILQVRRSFVAIRTFVQALKYGSDILKTIMELPITNSCENRLRQIGYCQQCSTSQSYHSNHNHHHQHSPYSQAQSRSSIGANSGTNPICQSSCVQTIERCCLSCRTHLNREWNKFLFEISRLASRLKTSFNIEHIVSPIHIQISDAIMNFQENGRTISQRQQQQPHLQSNQGSQVLNIDNIIDFMSEDFKVLKNFWSQLPQNLCSSASYSNDEKHCVRNETIRSQDDSINYRDKNNVEIMNQQISTMKLISINLNNAYNGLDLNLRRHPSMMRFPVVENHQAMEAVSSRNRIPKTRIQSISIVPAVMNHRIVIFHLL